MTLVLFVLFAAQCLLCQCHMPTFPSSSSNCAYGSDPSHQSVAIYVKIPSRSSIRCSFAISRADEELQLSVSAPLGHYSRTIVDALTIDISDNHQTDSNLTDSKNFDSLGIKRSIFLSVFFGSSRASTKQVNDFGEKRQ